MKSVSLVLGSGGARGLSHIGIIHWLDEHDYHIKSISGCSMGALIGGIYAAGKLDEFEKWVRAITKLDIIALLDISWSKSGLVKGDKIINTLIDLVNEININDHQKKKNNDRINEKINNYIQQLKKKIDLSQEVDWGAYEIANQAFDAMQSTIARQKLAAYPPDRSIEIARNACGTLEFDRARLSKG